MPPGAPSHAAVLATLFHLLLPSPELPAQESKPVEVVETWPDGTVKARFKVDAQGLKIGGYVSFHPNGRIALKTWYRADQPEGLWETFHQNGARHVVTSYKNGQLQGEWLESSEDGKHEVRASYKAGKLDGRLEVRDNGRVTMRHDWRAGELQTLDGTPAFPRSRAAIGTTLAELRARPLPVTWPGDPRLAERTAALRLLQSYRYLCDLPFDDLVLDARMCREADAAAHVCQVLGRLDHKPPNPGLPPEEYELGRLGAGRSNLNRGTTLEESVRSYMNDSDAENVRAVGHRRWCLNPSMRKVGFGSSGDFAAMWAHDDSRAHDGRGKAPAQETIMFPPRGFFPARLFPAQAAWSVSLDPARFQSRTAQDVKVEVYRLDERYLVTGAPLPLTDFAVDGGGYGWSPCIIFRPRGADTTPGSRYLVVLTLAEKEPARRLLRWPVEFVGS